MGIRSTPGNVDMDGGALERQAFDVHEMQAVVSGHEKGAGPPFTRSRLFCEAKPGLVNRLRSGDCS